MEDVVLLIGGNLGDRMAYILQATQALTAFFGHAPRRSSAIYETAAWGGASDGAYLNQALVFQSDRSPEQVLDALQQIELQLERTREVRWGDRTMDIDILFFGQRPIDTPRLQVPHPRIVERRFVLYPLWDLFPSGPLPVLAETVGDLLRACPDTCAVEKFSQEQRSSSTAR
ncbi:2-amino-4-hydroxy-6-hydroxymethyldihydropteridine pyrophosphokinase [Nitritalea halalkaliphila LW7]|uniref:2-amino-4-hydroxy-6-hydroxymethyldihydropteridine pyrophosphokinase n=1 Tax=Nitritalea halalkaliphila LW7 TaxID=1189621 RepID=I5BY28_9BACT|nr:2-amino-4-hydroxy-6-hydroxymethyldihydropteridine diphosphokinase [Nitritalea halalkaliphila]EIM74480.1 2-amino-4-hydroxy-6-hydroxymethyldihydropteridine pyrophosphokinase [Nitritalea halalkaliphila LW7]